MVKLEKRQRSETETETGPKTGKEKLMTEAS